MSAVATLKILREALDSWDATESDLAEAASIFMEPPSAAMHSACTATQADRTAPSLPQQWLPRQHREKQGHPRWRLWQPLSRLGAPLCSCRMLCPSWSASLRSAMRWPALSWLKQRF